MDEPQNNGPTFVDDDDAVALTESPAGGAMVSRVVLNSGTVVQELSMFASTRSSRDRIGQPNHAVDRNTAGTTANYWCLLMCKFIAERGLGRKCDGIAQMR